MPHLPKKQTRGYWQPPRVAHGGRRYKDGRYKTRRWQKLRALHLAQSPICNICERAAASVLDHIEPVRINPAGFWNEDNLQTVCRRCHDRKSATDDKQHPHT